MPFFCVFDSPISGSPCALRAQAIVDSDFPVSLYSFYVDVPRMHQNQHFVETVRVEVSSWIADQQGTVNKVPRPKVVWYQLL